MDRDEIFRKLMAMREKIEADIEEPLTDSDNSLLYDVAKTLGLTEEQAELLAGDCQPEPELSPAPAESPRDFSHSGLGIGGLATYDEPPIIPSAAALKRVERMEREAIICQRCGHSDVFDGAMFTTGGGDICDDCF